MGRNKKILLFSILLTALNLILLVRKAIKIEKHEESRQKRLCSRDNLKTCDLLELYEKGRRIRKEINERRFRREKVMAYDLS